MTQALADKRPSVILLAAVAKGNVIGVNNTLPWHLPEDLKRFKLLTTGQMVAMGRKTFDSIVDRLGKPLPNRHTVVITRDPQWKPHPGVLSAGEALGAKVSVVHSVAEMMQLAESAVSSNSPLYVVGGAEIYNATLPFATELDITEVDLDIPGDAFFPPIDPTFWASENMPWQVSESSDLRYRFLTFTRRKV